MYENTPSIYRLAFRFLNYWIFEFFWLQTVQNGYMQ
jgi:hypothetical protein